MNSPTRMGILTALGLFACTASANNLSITNVTLVNVDSGKADIEFDMSWDNSWRASWLDNGDTVSVTNWDAVWVFAKFRQSGGLWKHAILTATGHVATGGTTIEPADDGGTHLGAFVYRTADGSGSVACNNMRLRWDYVGSGIAGTNEVDITVMGIEMVYIPEGTYSLGSGIGGAEANHFYRYPDPGTPYVVSNEDAIVVGTDAGNLYYAGGGDQGGPIPADYPKGHQAIYCMKHEMTQGQYTDFLNLLDPGIANSYFPNKYNNARHTIAHTSTVYTVAAPDRACNFIDYTKIYTYLDWSGLRPMTELEFEKICRGVRSTEWPNEYAWGNTTYVEQTGHTGASDGSGMETAFPADANIHTTTDIYGPVRVGIFATTNSSRQQAGAGYYGVMDLSGNVNELVINVGRAGGRGFTDVYGDGSEYTAWPASWPAAAGYNGVGGRGGSLARPLSEARVSDRGVADSVSWYAGLGADRGARGVRTAP